MASKQLMGFYDGNNSRGLTRAQRERLKQEEFLRALEEEKIKGRARLYELKGKGTTFLAASFMENINALDDYRASLAKGNELKDVLLGEIEYQAALDLKSIQRRLNNEFDD
jgi:hypothetical protein